MVINDFDKNSPYGISMKDVGHIHSPYLRDVAKLGYNRYQSALSILLQTPKDYFEESAKQSNQSLDIDTSKLNELSMFDIYTANDEGRALLKMSLSLFIIGDFSWDDKTNQFLINATKENDKIYVDGYVNRENYSDVAKACLTMGGIKEEDLPEEHPKFKSEKDRLFYEKFMKKKEKHKKKGTPANPMFELPNMIAKICTYHNSLNYTNVYDLTVNQTYSTFWELFRQHQLQISEMNYAVWGGKRFDQKQWLEKMK